MTARAPRPGPPQPGTPWPDPEPYPGGPTGPRYGWKFWTLALSPGLIPALGLAGGWVLTVVLS